MIMEPKLREYIENLFAAAPHTRQAYELKEEIIRNTIERYHDLIAGGKTENEAYNLAIEGIGDVGELLDVLTADAPQQSDYGYNGNSYSFNSNNAQSTELFAQIKGRTSFFRSIALALFLLCITPCILFTQLYLFGHHLAPIGVAVMFWMISAAIGFLIYAHSTKFTPANRDLAAVSKIKRNAVINAVAVGMYISCATPCMVLGDFIGAVSAIFLFMLLAAATLLIAYGHKNKTENTTDEAFVIGYREWSKQKKPTSALYKILVAILWVSISVLYIIITIMTCTPVVTWFIFLLAAALQRLMRAIFDFTEVSK